MYMPREYMVSRDAMALEWRGAAGFAGLVDWYKSAAEAGKAPGLVVRVTVQPNGYFVRVRGMLGAAKGRCDLDNQVKTVLDALQEASGINDRSVVAVAAWRVGEEECPI